MSEKLRQAELIIDVPKKHLGDDADQITREGRLEVAIELSQRLGVAAACRSLNLSRATFYRRQS